MQIKELLMKINSGEITQEHLETKYKLYTNEMICKECLGEVRNTKSGVHVCYSCQNIEGELIEVDEFPELNIIKLNDVWIETPLSFNSADGI